MKSTTPAGKLARLTQNVVFADDAFEEHLGTVIERNRNLRLVRDDDGNEVWRCPFELTVLS